MKRKTAHSKRNHTHHPSVPKRNVLHIDYPLLVFSFICAFFFVFPSFWFPKQLSFVCANTETCAKNLKVEVENNAVGLFEKQKIIPPAISLSETDTHTQVLGEATASGEKHIYVDLTHQQLSAYQGDTLFMQTPISSGKWHPTPTGDFKIWVKLRATRMSGGSGDDYYNLPNVPYTMFFANDEVPKAAGFSLHGAYWHNNFGHPMSHGCVNMRIVDAEKLYNWASPTTDGYTTYESTANPGTTVTIYGTAPI